MLIWAWMGGGCVCGYWDVGVSGDVYIGYGVNVYMCVRVYVVGI